MAFRPVGDPPGRDIVCDGQKSLLINAFPAKVLETHFRAGYSFRSDPCTTAFAYDPDYCITGTVKADPESYGPEKDATIGMIQAAFTCTYGASLEDLHDEVAATINNNLWRSIESDLVDFLIAFPAVSQTVVPLQAVCALAEASQFLAANGNCGKGVIVGGYSWFNQLGTDHLVWDGKVHRDLVGNLVIPLSVDTDTVYAFDSNVDIRIAPVEFMEDLAPGIRTANDRVFRAEQVYTVAADPCIVGSFDVSDCCPCATGGGGGGGGAVTVTNFPANQNVTVTNFPAAAPEFDTEIIVLCDDNGPFLRRFTYDESTGLPTTTVTTDLSGAVYVPVGVVHDCAGNETDVPISTISVTSHHFDVVSGSPWTPAAIPAGRLIGLSHTVVVDTVTVVDSDGTSIAGIPAGFTQNWNVQDDRETLTPVTSITADTVTARSIVTMVVGTP